MKKKDELTKEFKMLLRVYNKSIKGNDENFDLNTEFDIFSKLISNKRIQSETNYTAGQIFTFVSGMQENTDISLLNILVDNNIEVILQSILIKIFAKHPLKYEEDNLSYLFKYIKDNENIKSELLVKKVCQVCNAINLGLSVDELKLYDKRKPRVMAEKYQKIVGIKKEIGLEKCDIKYMKAIVDKIDEFDELQKDVLFFAIKNDYPTNIFKRIANPALDEETMMVFVNAYFNNPTVERKKLLKELLDTYDCEELNEMDWDLRTSDNENLYKNCYPNYIEK